MSPADHRLRVAIVGFGRLGRACVSALRDDHDMELVGVVRRSPASLPRPFEQVPVAGHLRELQRPEVVLVCVPAGSVLGVAREILQQRLPIVECAVLEGGALAAHHEALAEAARKHRVAAAVGAGWDPGVLPLLRRLFDILIPRGRTKIETHPGLSLHHTAAAENIPGVEDALVSERSGADGRLQRYVYVQLSKGASLAEVERTLSADPLYAAERTLVFQLEDLSALEAAGAGIVLERFGASDAGTHQSLLLEARFDAAAFAARVMLDAARRLPHLSPGAHACSLGP